MVFNDYHQIAQSTLVETKYELKIYFLFHRKLPSNHGESTRNNDLYQIYSNLIIDKTELLDQNDLLEINNLKNGVYLIEVN